MEKTSSSESAKWLPELVTKDTAPMIPVFTNNCPRMYPSMGDYIHEGLELHSSWPDSLNDTILPNFGSSFVEPSQPYEMSPSSPGPQLIYFGNSSSLPTEHAHQNLSGANCIVYSVKPTTEAITTNHEKTFPVSCSDSNLVKDFSRGNSGQDSKKAVGGTMNQTSLHAQDHALAERKRRERLSQRFVALSAVIPGLKKMDKASVLGDTVKYVKQLQQRMEELEQEFSRNPMESAVVVKKSQFIMDTDGSCSVNNNSSQHQVDQQLPEIEARVLDNQVLIKVQCESSCGCISKILHLIEQMNLRVAGHSVIPFGRSILDITVVAQMEGDHSMTIQDIVGNLRQSLLNR